MNDNKNQLREDAIKFALLISDLCDEIKQTMSIWDTHPDILDEDGNFNGYNPEDDLPPVEMETGTIVVHDEGELFPPKRITDECVVCLTRRLDVDMRR